jgi:hypothetical protein
MDPNASMLTADRRAFLRAALIALTTGLTAAGADADQLQDAEDAAALAVRFITAVDAGDEAAVKAMYLPPPPPTFLPPGLDESALQKLRPMLLEHEQRYRSGQAMMHEREVGKRRARQPLGPSRIAGMNASGKGGGAFTLVVETDAQTPSAPPRGDGTKITRMGVSILKGTDGKLCVHQLNHLF